MSRVRPDPFVAILLLTVAAATFVPARGAAAPVVSALSTATVAALFFFHGARLPRENVLSAVRHWRLHATILSATFLLFPVLGFAVSKVLWSSLPPTLWTGVLFLCALPSTVQSSIAFTSIARGNVAGTVTAAAASNLLGIFLSPLIAALLTDSHGQGVSLASVWKIVLELLVPFLAGHLGRPWLAGWMSRHKALLTLTDRGTIVLAVYSAFSAAVLGGLWHRIPLGTLLLVVAVCLAILASVLVITRQGARVLGFAREDEISIVFCGSKKSLVTGIPMARVMFPAADAGAVILPLMMFHQIQLMVCAWLAQRYAARAPITTPVAEEA